jgi:hypothetical protein
MVNEALDGSERQILTKAEVAVLVGDALAQVDVASFAVAIHVPQGSAEDGNIAITFESEVNVLCRVGKAFAVPDEVACTMSAKAWMTL